MGQKPRAVSLDPGVTLVGGAPVDISVLKTALSAAGRIIAADGGADTCLLYGVEPERVIGDMDSLSKDAAAAFADRLFEVPEQDSTDFEKALREVDAPFVLAVGFLGARIDHALAVLSHLARRTGPPVILLSSDDCVLICPPEIDVPLLPGDRVSLWPLTESRLRSMGLHWPLDGLILSPVGQVGTSNRAEGPISLTCDGDCTLILPAERLEHVLTALGLWD